MNQLASKAFAALSELHGEISEILQKKEVYPGTDKEVYWPFSSDHAATEGQCERLSKGGWMQRNAIHRGGDRTGLPGYHCMFAWRLHPKHYNAAGVPSDLYSEHSKELYAGSETEKLMASEGPLSVYWTWKWWVPGGPNYWGHKMGPPVMEVRENGNPIFTTCPTSDVHAEFELHEFLTAHQSGNTYVPHELRIRTDEEISLWKDLGRIK